MTRRAAGLVLAGVTALGAGCRNTADGAREDARRAAREAEKAADDARKEIDRAAREAQRAADGARREMQRAASDARDAMREAGAEARKAGADARRDMQDAAEDARRDMRASAADLNAAKQLLDVRAALAVSEEISSASDISVRSDEAGRTIILSGSVPTAAEKDAAGRIARARADDLRVDNRLKVASGR